MSAEASYDKKYNHYCQGCVDRYDPMIKQRANFSGFSFRDLLVVICVPGKHHAKPDEIHSFAAAAEICVNQDTGNYVPNDADTGKYDKDQRVVHILIFLTLVGPHRQIKSDFRLLLLYLLYNEKKIYSMRLHECN